MLKNKSKNKNTKINIQLFLIIYKIACAMIYILHVYYILTLK